MTKDKMFSEKPGNIFSAISAIRSCNSQQTETAIRFTFSSHFHIIHGHNWVQHWKRATGEPWCRTVDLRRNSPRQFFLQPGGRIAKAGWFCVGCAPPDLFAHGWSGGVVATGWHRYAQRGADPASRGGGSGRSSVSDFAHRWPAASAQHRALREDRAR